MQLESRRKTPLCRPIAYQSGRECVSCAKQHRSFPQDVLPSASAAALTSLEDFIHYPYFYATKPKEICCCPPVVTEVAADWGNTTVFFRRQSKIISAPPVEVRVGNGASTHPCIPVGSEGHRSSPDAPQPCRHKRMSHSAALLLWIGTCNPSVAIPW